MAKEILSVRSNCNFALNYNDSKLHPQIEIIILTTQPDYALNKTHTGVTKKQKVEETRFTVSPEGLNNLIGQLQMAAQNALNFDQLSGFLNPIIEQHVVMNKHKKDGE